ncbi:hypothetical protein B7992_08590 [Fibrobacter sp. UWH1]|nr:hypothetical protein B7992_08590 [Fibrobacter sp. UWH1]
MAKANAEKIAKETRILDKSFILLMYKVLLTKKCHLRGILMEKLFLLTKKSPFPGIFVNKTLI